MLSDGQTTRSPRGELALGGGEDALDRRARTVAGGREARPHLRPHALELPTGFAVLGGDDAISAHMVTVVVMVALAIKLGFG